MAQSEKIQLPAFHYFKVGNGYTGQAGDDKRYKLSVDKGEEKMVVQIWSEPYCLEKSEVLEAQKFELTEEGFQEAQAWLSAIE